MSAVDGNHRGADTWAGSWTHFRVERRSPADCRVTFDHPPINAIAATTVAELAELVGLIEQDGDLNVVVFDSADPRFYLDDSDPESSAAGMRAWRDLLDRLARAPAVSIASIRGRVRGAGCAFVLACDLRFVSRENARLGHPGGGPPAARLPPLVGRGRALEILLAAEDVDGPRAELYGYVNRSIADGRLDEEVDEIAARLGRLDHDAVARTKAQVGG